MDDSDLTCNENMMMSPPRGPSTNSLDDNALFLLANLSPTITSSQDRDASLNGPPFSPYALSPLHPPRQTAPFGSPFADFNGEFLLISPSRTTTFHDDQILSSAQRSLIYGDVKVEEGLQMPSTLGSSSRESGFSLRGEEHPLHSLPVDRKRTKSVITPVSRKRTAVRMDYGGFSRRSNQSEDSTWISVKVSPTLEPREGLGHAPATRGQFGSRIELSNAIKTINSKFRGELPPRQTVAVSAVNATAQLCPDTLTRQPASTQAHANLFAESLDSLPSPPKFGLSECSNTLATPEASKTMHTRSMNHQSTTASAPVSAQSSRGSLTASATEEDPPNAAVNLKRKPCNCRNSKCLKLYCDCFAMSRCCDGCNCKDCHNNPEHESERQEARQATLEKNPNAFQAKITKAKQGGSSHSSGCNCKKSKCLKKYCECFHLDVFCGEKCKCLECQNFEGSKELLQRKSKKESKKPASVTPPKNNGSVSPQSSSPNTSSSASASHPTVEDDNQFRPVALQRAEFPAHLAFNEKASLEPSMLRQTRQRTAENSAKRQIVNCTKSSALLVRAFQFLPDDDLLNCSLVCKTWVTPAFDKSLWHYPEDS